MRRASARDQGVPKAEREGVEEAAALVSAGGRTVIDPGKFLSMLLSRSMNSITLVIKRELWKTWRKLK